MAAFDGGSPLDQLVIWGIAAMDRMYRALSRYVGGNYSWLEADPERAAPVIAGLDRDIAKYRAEAPHLADEAKAEAERYDALNVHDDQFDSSDAAISTAISIAAVSALAESGWLLASAWVFGAFGLFMGLCGFAGWGFHLSLLSGLLG
jgi:hypothetical protein